MPLRYLATVPSKHWITHHWCFHWALGLVQSVRPIKRCLLFDTRSFTILQFITFADILFTKMITYRLTDKRAEQIHTRAFAHAHTHLHYIIIGRAVAGNAADNDHKTRSTWHVTTTFHDANYDIFISVRRWDVSNVIQMRGIHWHDELMWCLVHRRNSVSRYRGRQPTCMYNHLTETCTPLGHSHD